MKTFVTTLAALLLAGGAAGQTRRLPCPGWCAKIPGAKAAYDALSPAEGERLLVFCRDGKADAVGGPAFFKLVSERGDSASIYVLDNYASLKDDPDAMRTVCAEPWVYFRTPRPDAEAPKPPPAPEPPSPWLFFGAGAVLGAVGGRLSTRSTRRV